MTRNSTTTQTTAADGDSRSPATEGAPTTGTPVSAATRLVGIDIARGLAILGMIAVHSLNEYDSNGDPTWTFSLDAGRSSAIFALLAGVSITLICRRRRLAHGPQASATAASLLARAVMIGLIGLALGYTDADYGVVILPYYAVMFALAIPLTYLRTRTLAILAPIAAITLPVLSHLARPHLAQPLTIQPSFSLLTHHPIRLIENLTVTGEYPAFVWMTYVICGMIVGRLTLTSVRTAGRVAVAGLALACSAAAASWVLLHPLGGLAHIRSATDPGGVEELLAFGGDGTTPTTTWWWLCFDGPHTGTPLDLAATIGSALFVLGGLMLLTQLPWRRVTTWIRRGLAPLAAAGSMSLTVYTGHIMFINSDFDRYSPWAGYFRQVVVILVVTLAWRATAGRGPLEGLVTGVTRRVREAVLTHADRPGHPDRAGDTARHEAAADQEVATRHEVTTTIEHEAIR